MGDEALNFPDKITGTQLFEAFTVMGIDPTAVRRVEINLDTITVTARRLVRCDESGELLSIRDQTIDYPYTPPTTEED